jgi:hypothetical protein
MKMSEVAKLSMKKSEHSLIVGAVRKYENKVGADLREYIVSDRYTGPTKSGLWIPLDKWNEFKALVQKVDEEVEVQKTISKEKNGKAKELQEAMSACNTVK